MQNNEISEIGRKHIAVILKFSGSDTKPGILKEFMSQDMILVLQEIIRKVVKGMLTMYPELPEVLGDIGFKELNDLFYMAITTGAMIYWAECQFLKDNHVFIRYKGRKFQDFLLKGFQDYFVDGTKNLSDFIEDEIDDEYSSYIMESVNYYGNFYFRIGFLDKGSVDELHLLKKMADYDPDMINKLDIITQLRAFVLNGYVLCRIQDEYREIGGIPESKKALINMHKNKRD